MYLIKISPKQCASFVAKITISFFVFGVNLIVAFKGSIPLISSNSFSLSNSPLITLRIKNLLTS